MKTTRGSTVPTMAALLVVLWVGGCGRAEPKVDEAAERSGDALDLLEYKRFKDTAEDAGAAIEEAAERTRRAVEDARD